MELYEQIRQEYEHGAGTIRAVARKLGVHRREVRKASSIHSAFTEIGCGPAKWRVNLTIASTMPAQTTAAAMMTVSGATS